jgi:hypothetical protein
LIAIRFCHRCDFFGPTTCACGPEGKGDAASLVGRIPAPLRVGRISVRASRSLKKDGRFRGTRDRDRRFRGLIWCGLPGHSGQRNKGLGKRDSLVAGRRLSGFGGINSHLLNPSGATLTVRSSPPSLLAVPPGDWINRLCEDPHLTHPPDPRALPRDALVRQSCCCFSSAPSPGHAPAPSNVERALAVGPNVFLRL